MAEIELRQGNLLQADAEALVNTVNCVGIMGKGVALQFRQAYPENFREYSQACRANEVKPGRMFVVAMDRFVNPKYIINFPTKRHWKGKSRIEDIEAGLEALVEEIRQREIRTIAIPPLGCGNGGLDWGVVRPLIEASLKELPHLRVLLYEPQRAPDTDAMPIATKKPRMTRGRAVIVQLIDLYNESLRACGISDYRLTMLEVQKLAYFLQAAGERLKLDYVRHKYGPYAENLHHVLQRMEGHYLRGYGDRSGQAAIFVLPTAMDEARAALADDARAKERIGRVGRLVEGFETPYGMELLATVHWVAHENPDTVTSDSAAIEAVHHWDERKRNTFKPQHIRKAWQRLYDEDWLLVPSTPEQSLPQSDFASATS